MDPSVTTCVTAYLNPSEKKTSLKETSESRIVNASKAS